MAAHPLLLIILGKSLRLIALPKASETSACFCSTSAPNLGEKGRVKLTSATSTRVSRMHCYRVHSPIHN